MIDIAHETTISFSEAADSLPTRRGRKPHIASIHRWATRGFNGVCLEYLKLGGQRITSVEAVQRFLDRLTEQDQLEHGITPEQPTVSRQKSIQAAEKRLARS